MNMSDVAVVSGERSLDTVHSALDAIPFAEALEPWDQVLIKINLITSKTWDTGVTTDPIVVEALVERVKDLGKGVFVVETDAQMTDADKAVVDTCMMDMLDRVGVEFINMRHEDVQVELPVTDGRKLKSIKVAKLATESAIISAAKMKTLHGTQVTLGLKNMFGMLTTKWKFLYHRHGMHNVIHDVVKALFVAAVIVKRVRDYFRERRPITTAEPSAEGLEPGIDVIVEYKIRQGKVVFGVVVRNESDVAMQNVQVTLEVPDLTETIKSENIGTVEAGHTSVIEIDFELQPGAEGELVGMLEYDTVEGEHRTVNLRPVKIVA